MNRAERRAKRQSNPHYRKAARYSRQADQLMDLAISMEDDSQEREKLVADREAWREFDRQRRF